MIIDIKIQYTEDQYKNQIDFFRKKIRAFPSHNSILQIDEYAERNRIMPAEGSPRPGPWSNEFTPYLIETMQNLSPNSSIQREIVMKGAQGGWTALAENVICYYMDEMPADILFVSATQQLLERWAARRLEPAIDSCGIRLKISHQTENAISKKSGDKAYSKEYSGCRLDMASARSSPALAATDKRILIRDEIDRAPILLSTGEGNWLDVSYARTNFWSTRRKVYDLSTPTLEGESQIYEAYKYGDQRKFLIPCPRCGVFQELKFGSEDTQYGLKPDTKAGELQDVYYLCDHCHDAFSNNEKCNSLPLGYWEASARSSDPTVVSRHWSSLYSPIGALNWKEIYQQYLKALNDPLSGLRAFMNLYLGLPYKQESTRPNPKRITRGSYKKGIVPENVLFLTAGVDVQAGKKRDEKKSARLEMEICGHGIGYRTYSIDYKIIKGAIDDPYAGAWQNFYEMLEGDKFIYKRADGIEIPLVLILIDARYQTDAVFNFCERGLDHIYAAEGFKYLSQRKDESIDEMTASELKRYRWSKSGEHGFFNIATVFFKRIIYANLKIPRLEIGPQKPGFCDFPLDYKEEYFRQLTAEEMRDGGKTFYLPMGRSNEALDCRVLNLAAGHIFLDEQLRRKREFFKKQGATLEQLKQIGHIHILREIESVLNEKIKEMRERK